VEEIGSLIKKRLQAFRLIHLVMVMADVIYAVVIVYIYKYAPIPPMLTDVHTIVTIEYSSVAFIAIVIIAVNVMRKKLLSSDSIFIKKETAKGNSDEPPFLANYFSSLFILWAIIETIIVGGIVLFLTTGNLMVPLVLISIGGFFKLLSGPRLEELNQLAAKHSSLLVQG
jgi:hypothetical protein